VLNVLAELTYFADRGFYADWWNSVSWDQFARDWNRPYGNLFFVPYPDSTISLIGTMRHPRASVLPDKEIANSF
jgi:sterol O-acyltransferase